MWDLKAPEKVQEEMVDGDTAYEVVSLEALPEYTGELLCTGFLRIQTALLWRIPSCGTTWMQ